MKMLLLRQSRGWRLVVTVLAGCALLTGAHLALRVHHPATEELVAHHGEKESSSRSNRHDSKVQDADEELFVASDVKADDLADFEKFFLPNATVEIQAAASKAEHERHKETAESVTMPPELKTAMENFNELLPEMLRSFTVPKWDVGSALTISKPTASSPAKSTGQLRAIPTASGSSSMVRSLKFPCLGTQMAPWVQQCDTKCSSKSKKIPNVIHMILLNNKFGFLLWIVVRSAVVMARADAVNIFSTVPIQKLTNCWVRRVLEIPTVHFHYTPWSKFPMVINGRKMQFIQHYSDWLRLAILWRYGGVYMDTDSIITKPLLPLLHNHAVLSRQATSLPGNGMMIARDHSCFICFYSRMACTYFNGSWASHSSLLLGKMFDPTKKEPLSRSPLLDNIRMLSHMQGFFPFSWTKAGLGAMFDVPMTKKMRRSVNVYALHLFNFVSKDKQKMLKNYLWLSRGTSLLSTVIRQLLPTGFTRASFSERKCIAIH